MATVCIFCITCFYTLCVHDFWTFWHHNLIFQYETQPSFRYFFSLWEFMSGLLPQVEGGQSFTNKSQYSLKHTSLRRSGRGGQSCRRDTPQLFQKHTPHWVPDVLPWWDCNALRIAGPYLLRGHGSVWEKLPQSSTEKQVIWWEWSCLTGKPVECVFCPELGCREALSGWTGWGGTINAQPDARAARGAHLAELQMQFYIFSNH